MQLDSTPSVTFTGPTTFRLQFAGPPRDSADIAHASDFLQLDATEYKPDISNSYFALSSDAAAWSHASVSPTGATVDRPIEFDMEIEPSSMFPLPPPQATSDASPFFGYAPVSSTSQDTAAAFNGVAADATVNILAAGRAIADSFLLNLPSALEAQEDDPALSDQDMADANDELDREHDSVSARASIMPGMTFKVFTVAFSFLCSFTDDTRPAAD